MVKSMLYGRLGNQLFQKAASIGYAARYGIEYDLSGRHLQGIRINEDGHHYQELPFYANSNIILNGYWQSQKYFSHCREEVLKVLAPITTKFKGTCSIHLRRGDYVNYPDKHPVITADYLDQAIAYICNNTGISRFIVFSDDIPYTRSLIESRLYCGCDFSYSEGQSEWQDMALMASQEHHIIANSTFSWWGAYFGWNPDKVVISPSKDNWFGPGNANLCTDDIIPDSWIQIKY